MSVDEQWHKATLHFTSITRARLRLESVWWARTGPGPVENWIVVRNTGSSVATWAAPQVHHRVTAQI